MGSLRNENRLEKAKKGGLEKKNHRHQPSDIHKQATKRLDRREPPWRPAYAEDNGNNITLPATHLSQRGTEGVCGLERHRGKRPILC